MKDNKITLPKNFTHLPNFYALPKMHKIIPKMRYIAASNKCTTKPLSQIITKCLKLITIQHKRYCNQIYNRTGVNRMWVINNSNDVLDKIKDYNDNSNNDEIKNINTYDFSTLYTNIPHDDLKDKMKWVINTIMKDNRHIYISSNGKYVSFKSRHNTIPLNAKQLITYINYLIDNIFITVSDKVYRQVIGIPMGTDCAPFLANLYLYALEFKFLDKMTKENISLARKFSNSFRYIDDLLTFNNDDLMNKYMNEIYPKELVLNKENKHDTHCTFLDIDIKIHTTNNTKNKIHTDIYDKRDDFNFNVNNFPILSGNIHFKNTHNIIISQLLRYNKVCNKESFIQKTKDLINKLTQQFFCKDILIKTCSSFYTKYYHLIEKYNITRKQFLLQIQ